MARQRTRFRLIGIGLNVNFDPDEWSEQIDRPATSLMLELGEPQSREDLLAAILNQFERAYADWDRQELWESWKARLNMLNRDVRIVRPNGGDLLGYAQDVSPDGALILRRSDGALEAINAGRSQPPPGLTAVPDSAAR